MSDATVPQLHAQLAGIQASMAAGRVLQAEMSCLKLLEQVPDCVPALAIVARCAADRDDHARAASFWKRARAVLPGDEGLLYQEALAAVNQDNPVAADELLAAHWVSHRQLVPENWLAWGHIKQRLGQKELALKAWFRAVDRAQRQGRWLSQATTEPDIQPAVLSAMRQLAAGKQALLLAALEPARREFGSHALVRVDRALANYLGASRDGPTDPRQRPKFLYIPGLTDMPYHDPRLQSWANRLDEACDVIRGEALALLSDRGQFESFLTFGPNANVSDYVGGDGEKPSWDAFFFYRHGQRYDANHIRCPQTSQVLDSIDLCRIRGQAPEVCFSLLAPGSHIKAHHGVTNSRLVMHLPLKVPRDCALNVIDAGEHHWREGRLMMFDDTYQHEAWNRSSDTRVILLMDCWNPQLSAEERLAITALVECISDFENVF
jgi:aspartate beta-hydroxylase